MCVANASRACREIGEPRLLPEECEPHDARRPVALLRNDQLGGPRIRMIRIAVVGVLAINHDHDVGVLFERAGFAKVRELRAVVGPCLRGPRQLRERDDRYDPDSANKGMAEIIIGKQRNGPTGSLKLKFFGEYTRFDNLAHDSVGSFE